MANPIARMLEYKRPRIGKNIRPAKFPVAVCPQPDPRCIQLHAGHTPVDLMRYIIGVLFAAKGDERC